MLCTRLHDGVGICGDCVTIGHEQTEHFSEILLPSGLASIFPMPCISVGWHSTGLRCPDRVKDSWQPVY